MADILHTLGTPSEPVTHWQPERDNWSTTIRSEYQTDHPERFTERELASGEVVTVSPGEPTGWFTEPENGLTPSCEPVDGRCACGRSA